MISLETVKRDTAPICANDAASLWALGDGVACFEMHTKMNSFAPAAFDLLEEALSRGGKDYRALVIGNDDPRAFSAGADLSFIYRCIEAEDWRGLRRYLAHGGRLFLEMKYAGFPVVAAAHGLALGGGCEFMLHANAAVAHADLRTGLPETKVGLVPGWGGTTQLMVRLGGSDAARRVFDQVLAGTVSENALQARDMALLRADDLIVADRAVLLDSAARVASEMARDFVPPSPASIPVAGVAALLAQRVTASGEGPAAALAGVLSGGSAGAENTSESQMMALELDALIQCAQTPAAREKIAGIVNKPKNN